VEHIRNPKKDDIMRKISLTETGIDFHGADLPDYQSIFFLGAYPIK